MLYERVWLPTGEVLSPLPEQLSKEEADRRNAALAAQGIMTVRWRLVDVSEPEEQPFPEAARMHRYGW